MSVVVTQSWLASPLLSDMANDAGRRQAKALLVTRPQRVGRGRFVRAGARAQTASLAAARFTQKYEPYLGFLAHPYLSGCSFISCKKSSMMRCWV